MRPGILNLGCSDFGPDLNLCPGVWWIFWNSSSLILTNGAWLAGGWPAGCIFCVRLCFGISIDRGTRLGDLWPSKFSCGGATGLLPCLFLSRRQSSQI